MTRILFLLILSIMAVPLFSQESYSPTRVAKAAFFDKTPPLIEMEQRQPSPQDNSWKDGVVGNESLLLNRKGNENYITDLSSTQTNHGSKQSKGPIISIDGVGNVNGVAPPDTDGDVGPNHYIQMINLSFAIYDKQGNKLYGPVANSTLWSGFPGPWAGTNDGDPIILYDELADRWMASQFAIYTSNNKYYELIAVSETGDPLGSWYRYAFEFDEFPDYPKLSVWPDGYYATFHMFAGQFQGTAFVAFEREKMLVGDPNAQMVYFGEYGNKFGFQPADVDGDAPAAGTPGYFTGINFWGNHTMEIWKMEVDWDNTNNSSFTLDVLLTPDSFNNNIGGIPQPGTGNELDDFGNNLMFRLPYRNFGNYSVMLANHAVRVGNRAGIRWYEMRDEGSGWYIYQQGTYAPDNENRWMGSIAMAADGTIALGYSVSSSTVYPSIRYTGRSPDAPLGEMNLDEIEVVAGAGSQSGLSRWGDYSCMSVDPVNDSVFWFTTEYMPGGGWGTHIVAFDFGEVQPPTAFAGVDASVCESELFQCEPTAQYYNSVLWETSGDGIFQNTSLLNTKYLRGNGDIENGSVTLTLTVYGFQPGWEDSDDMILTIVKEPEALAGNDTTVNFSTVQMNANAISYSSVEWSTSGDGDFENSAILNALYNAGTNDIINGEVDLTLTAFAEEPCEEEDSDDITVFFDLTTGIDIAGKKNQTLNIIPNPADGRFTIELADVESGEYKIKIMDITGRISFEESRVIQSNSASFEVDLSANGKGMYFLEVISENNRILEKIIIK